jgi:DNA-directed RNA polymerase subunit RPC12/RpoP
MEKSHQQAPIPPQLKVKVESLRCENCDRFLAYYALVEGTLVIKCRRCGHWTALDVHNLDLPALDKPEIKP